jgi:acyl carrier protein
METELITLIAVTLGVNETAITLDSSSENTEGWDSLAHMSLVFAIEDHFSIQISDADLPHSMSVLQLLRIVQESS